MGAMRFWTAVFAAALAAPWLAVPGGSALRAAELQPLEIVTKPGCANFSVELAATDEELDRGLMYRRELPDGRGMLFDFGRTGRSRCG